VVIRCFYEIHGATMKISNDTFHWRKARQQGASNDWGCTSTDLLVGMHAVSTTPEPPSDRNSMLFRYGKMGNYGAGLKRILL